MDNKILDLCAQKLFLCKILIAIWLSNQHPIFISSFTELPGPQNKVSIHKVLFYKPGFTKVGNTASLGQF